MTNKNKDTLFGMLILAGAVALTVAVSSINPTERTHYLEVTTLTNNTLQIEMGTIEVSTTFQGMHVGRTLDGQIAVWAAGATIQEHNRPE